MSNKAEALEPFRSYLEVLARVHLDPRLKAWLQQQSVPEGQPLYSPPAGLKFLQDHPIPGLAIAVWVISVGIWLCSG
jgi:hypothetical protein